MSDFWNAFLRGLAAPAYLFAPFRPPPRGSMADDWRKIGDDLRKVSGDLDRAMAVLREADR